MSFTLHPRSWYGWQMIPGYVGERCVPFCCPCHVRAVTPHKSGKGLLTLEVWITGYAEGVQMMEVPLRVIHRGKDYLIARILSPNAPDTDRCVVISHVEFEWLRQLCPALWQSRPPEHFGSAAMSSVSVYLNALFHVEDPAGTPPAFQIQGKTAQQIAKELQLPQHGTEERKMLLHLAKLVVKTAAKRGNTEAVEELDDFLDVTSGRMGIPPMTWKPELSCDEVVFAVLRFDGGRWDKALECEHPLGRGTYGQLAQLYEEHFSRRPWKLHDDPMVNWGVLYWLQRSQKWSGLPRKDARLLAWLFTQLHDQPVPRGYAQAEYAEKYQRLMPAAAELAQKWTKLLGDYPSTPDLVEKDEPDDPSNG